MPAKTDVKCDQMKMNSAIRIDEKAYDRLAERCNTEGYSIGRLASILIHEGLDRRPSAASA